MSLNTTRILMLGLLTLTASSAWASCTRLAQPTVQLDMVVGRIVVRPDLPVGAVITSQTWTMRAAQGASYNCTPGVNRFVASVVASGAVDLGNKVYSTNVPGIGLRFRRSGATVNLTYPDVYAPVSNVRTSYSLEGSTFTLEVIKTAAITGSGTLAAGKYTSYDWDGGNNPFLETYLSASAITVVSPSCTVVGGNNMNVDIGTIKRTDLNGVGSSAGGKAFNIQLQCSGGVSAVGFANINTTFSGTLATGTAANQGVLLNEKSGSIAAQGVGVQVLKDGVPLEFNKRYTVGTLRSDETRYLTLPYNARFYQYLPATTSGEVESHMIFNLTYD